MWNCVVCHGALIDSWVLLCERKSENHSTKKWKRHTWFGLVFRVLILQNLRVTTVWSSHQTLSHFSLWFHSIRIFASGLWCSFNYLNCFNLSDHKAYGLSAQKNRQVVTAIEYQGRVIYWFSRAVSFISEVWCIWCYLSICWDPLPCFTLILPSKMPHCAVSTWEFFLHLLNGNFGPSMKDLMYKEGLLLHNYLQQSKSNLQNW